MRIPDMVIALLAAAAVIPAAAAVHSAAGAVWDIRAAGAREGGTYKNTAAIRASIDAASRAGGGRVLIPAGRWLTGAIHFESNIELHLDRGAELVFSSDTEDYLPPVFARHEEIECTKYSALLYARGKRNIAITGEGVLDGAGERWWRLKKEGHAAEELLYRMGAGGVPAGERVFDGSDGRALRPAFFQPVECVNVAVEGVTFRASPMWTIVPTYCDSVKIRNVTVVTAGAEWSVPNGDGVDISSSRHVLIEGCSFDTGDDCIVLKSGRDEDGLRVGRPTEEVVIRGCAFARGHGGIVIGSETAGGIRNVLAEDCTFRGTDRMVRIKTARGRGGAVEHLLFRRLRGEEIAAEAILVTSLYTGERFPAGAVTASTPRVRNIAFEDITCLSGHSYAVELLGLPEMPVRNISFDSLRMSTDRGVRCVDARDIRFTRTRAGTQAAPFPELTDCAGVTVDGVTAPGSALLPATPDRVDTSLSWSRRIVASFLRRHPDGVTYDSAYPAAKWTYEQGLMLNALWRAGADLRDARCRDFVKENLDQYVTAQGEITTYRFGEFQLDNIAPGCALLDLYAATHEERYRKAAAILRRQLREQPRTSEGGFWHKNIYPWQMWLDGLYMAAPFYVRYGVMSGEADDAADAVRQFRLIEAHCRDPKTGLYFHGWDERRAQRWADPASGCSPTFWGRSMGWLMMALVDVLDALPPGAGGRDDLLRMLRDLTGALGRVRDAGTRLWYQVPDRPGLPGNYIESSASAMFAYAMARGANRGYLGPAALAAARETFDALTRRMVTCDAQGNVDLHGISAGAGLGGSPTRDGSAAYYTGVPRGTNDIKGYAPFLLAAIELERAAGALPEDRHK